MNLNTIAAVKRPSSADEIGEWRDGYAWLAGGTWLFSTPQVHTDTLIDLESLQWPALQVSADGLEIAATCTLADLAHFKRPGELEGGARCSTSAAEALLGSFKIWNAATVGGNICMSLPAGPMISLTACARRRLHAVAAGRRAAQSSGGRFRDRQPRERAAARRTASQHPSAGQALSQAAIAFRASRSRTSDARQSLLIGTQ